LKDEKVGFTYILLRNLETSPSTNKLAHLLIPNCISLFLAYLLANFNNLLKWDRSCCVSLFVGWHCVTYSNNVYHQLEVPYLSQLLKISLMNKLNKIGKRGQPWRTPFLILNNFDNYPSTHTQALEDKYKFSVIFIALLLIPKWWIFINTLYMGIKS